MFRYLMILLLTWSSASWSLGAQDKAHIDQLVDQKMRVDGIPGAAYAVIKSGEIAHRGALGLANVELKVAVNQEHLFRSGSLVKPMTAVAILQLAAANKIDLDAPISRYCAEFPRKSQPVSVRALLSHTAGIRSYRTSWMDLNSELYSAKRYSSIVESLSAFSSDPLQYEPGSEYVYSSYGYNLLGCAIESVSQQSYLAYLQKRVFAIAGMHRTMADVPEKIIYGRVSGYIRKRKGRLQNEQYVDMSNKIPSGGLLTNVSDMAKFAIAFMTGKLLDEEYQNLAVTPTRLNDGTIIDYGLGWKIERPRSNSPANRAYHGGVTPGLTGILYLDRNSRSGFVFLCNLYGVKGREALARRVLRVVAGDGFVIRD